jgi:prepilin-type N-terminal cleavage/methylation domain-containing protein
VRRAPESLDARHLSLAPLLAASVSLLPVLGLFTTGRVFFIRDLSFFFWSRHLWLRHAMFAGAPWWDPYVAGGQSAVADALYQLLMPITIAIRLLPSDVISFNLWVALPLPVAAIGTHLFLRRQVSEAAAGFGACVFALSGPIVSMLNTPNLAWSVALMPWVLWSSRFEVRGSRIVSGFFERFDRPRGAVAPDARTAPRRTSILDPRTSVTLAVAFALQGLCGEPVTWLATAVLVLGYAPALGTAIGLLAGAGLASAQLVPTLIAGVHAQRSALATPDFWSLHPVALWEMVAPHLFGDFYTSTLADLPWMGALNFGRDPFFYSLYVGPLVLLLAAIGAGAGRRAFFWVAVAGVSLLAALGGYTPIYPLVRRALPELLYFRFPAKYFVFTMFAGAVLAAEGWAALADHSMATAANGDTPRRARLVAAAAGVLALAIVLLAVPALTARAAGWLAVSTHLKDPGAGAAFLSRTAPPLAIRAAALCLVAALLIAAAHRRRQAAWLLAAVTCADLVLANRALNPTIAVERLSAPSWYTASAGASRLYIGGRVRGFMNAGDPDATPVSQVPHDESSIARRAELNAELPLAPSGWGIREALSYDLPYLWPAEYEAVVAQFEQAAPGARAAFLRRAGVRRCILPAARDAGAAIADVADWSMRVFECGPDATRVFIASRIEAASGDNGAAWQRNALFDTTLADTLVRVPHAPATAGRPSAPGPASARIVDDRSTTVIVEATLPVEGVLVLRDSYDPSWHAEVDGLAAEIVRANGLYRAVALPAGRHVIRFAYRPRDLAAGLIMSGVTALMLLGGRFTRARRAVRDGGFTLIELMIVLAIIGVLLAIAFTEYRGMQARGNETSALTSMRAIAVAQWQFSLTCGNLKYATKLTDLAKPVPASGEGFLSPDLSSAESFEKSGYVFQMAAKPLDDVRPACNGAAVAAGYSATADPARPGVSGTAYYGVNADRILYIDEEKTFTGTLPESGAPDHGNEVKK